MDDDTATKGTLLADPAPTLPADPKVILDGKALTADAVAVSEGVPLEETSFGDRAAKACQSALLRVPSFLLGLFPCIAWIGSYNLRMFLVPDVLAGLSVAVLHIPQGLVSAIIAGVDPVLGLYSSLYPAVIYVIMGSSPYVSLGMFPVTALMTGVVVQKYSIVSQNATAPDGGGAQVYTEQSGADVAITLTFMTGIIQVALWLFRLDRLAAIISPVMAEGFLTGCAVMVIVSQLPSVFGSGVQSGKGIFGTPLTVYHVAKNIPYSNLATALLSLAAFLVLVVSKGVIARQMRRFTAVPLPSDLILVAVATATSHFLELDSKHNVKVVGHIASGFPKPTAPTLDGWASLLPDAVAIAVVQFVSSFSIAELFGRKQRLKTDASQEMLAYGMSSVVGSFFMCIPTGSALARSVVLKDVGAKTQVSGIVSCVFVAVTLYAFAPIFRPLPECVLGVVIIVVLLPMLAKLGHLRKFWVISRFDFALWLLSCLSVVLLNATYGLLVGILLGLLVIFLELNGHKGSRLQPRKPDVFVPSEWTSREDTLKIYRAGGPFCFATHHSIVAEFEELFTDKNPARKKAKRKLHDIEAHSEAVTTSVVVMDCSAISFFDSTGVGALDQVLDMCQQNKCILYLASLQDSALRTIKTQKALFEKIGDDHIAPTIQDAVALANYELPPRLLGIQLQTHL
ncbi:sulfate transporter-like isoform X1 [Dermacentor andersoni]|uniref:sulfate transporter-like isoform X1 n=1 Tax=Dermacentor andersoni TaxID=34620 RepID=UPI002416B86E|nr:sulfate transporter-like isoform X1 [Dermacentor andersoni]